MARKKVESEKPAAASKLRAVRLELDDDLHRLLRLEAARRDVSLAVLARELVAEGLKSSQK